MTIDDINIVEENVHLKHFIFELVRCIDECIPVTQYFACTDRQGGVDDTLLNAEKYIVNALMNRQFYGGNGDCKYKVGDKIVKIDVPGIVYTITDFAEVYLGGDRTAWGVVLSGVGNPMVYNIEYVNRHFKLL